MVDPLGILTLSSGAFIMSTHTRSCTSTITVFALLWYAFWSPVFGVGNYTINQFYTNCLAAVVVWTIAGWSYAIAMNSSHLVDFRWWDKKDGRTYLVMASASMAALLAPYVFVELWKYMPMWATALLTITTTILVHIVAFFFMRDVSVDGRKLWETRYEASTFYTWHCLYLLLNAMVFCILQNTLPTFLSGYWDLYSSMIVAGTVIVVSFLVARFAFSQEGYAQFTRSA